MQYNNITDIYPLHLTFGFIMIYYQEKEDEMIIDR
jgi:hypothetical protein